MISIKRLHVLIALSLSVTGLAGCHLQATHWTGGRPSQRPHGPAKTIEPRNSNRVTTHTATADPSLNAVLYMQTSAEYEALCRQVFRQALEQVRAQADAKQGGKPPAVVMDLDETILDNGWYGSEQIRRGEVGFNPASWNDFVLNHIDKIRLVPGAEDFIHQCEALKIPVFYITNRTSDQRDATVKTLERLGLGNDELHATETLRLQLKPADRKSNSKDERRARVASRYEIIALIGDNLGDVSGVFDKSSTMNSIEARREMVLSNAAEFGRRWFILPNPEYGEWERFINKRNPLSALYQ